MRDSESGLQNPTPLEAKEVLAYVEGGSYHAELSGEIHVNDRSTRFAIAADWIG